MLAAALLLAQLVAPQPKGAGTNVTVVSDIAFEPRWERSVVTEDGRGNIRGDRGTVGSKAALDAAAQMADEANQISVAAKSSVSSSVERIRAALPNMAKNALGIVFSLAPAQDTEDLMAYTVKTTSDGVTDTQYVWYSQDLYSPPARYVNYVMAGGAFSNRVKSVWQRPFTNTVDVTVGGVTWRKCHVCTVERPDFAVGRPCVDKWPNDTWGAASGFDFGAIDITVGGRHTLTGVRTNKLDNTKWVRFEAGILKEKSWED